MSLTWNEIANKWEGDATTPDPAKPDIVVMVYADLPNPANVPKPPVTALVYADPIDALNGVHWCDGKSWRGV